MQYPKQVYKMPMTTRATAASARSAMPSTPPRVQRIPVCPDAPSRVRPVPTPLPPTTPIVLMKIEMREHGCADEEVDEDDNEAWMTSTLNFASRDAMVRYFKYLFESGGGNGFESAIILGIEESSSLDKFLEKIAKDTGHGFQINKNLSISVYNTVIIN